jgi:hypothetical protein
MVPLSGPETVIAGRQKKRESFVCRYFVVVHSILLDLRSSVLRKKPDLKKRGKILNIFSLVRVR